MNALPCIWKEFVEFLDQWQTLLAGSFAIFAAGITVWRMKGDADDQRRRRLRACRAMMPPDLSSICEYTSASILASCEALEAVRSSSAKSRAIAIPVLSERVLSNLQVLVEQLDDGDHDAVSDLVACYQIQHSRLRGEIDDLNELHRLGVTKVSTESNIEFTFPKTVELYLIATKMFPFARRTDEHIPPLRFSDEEVENAISVLEFRDVVSPDFIARLKAKIREDGY